MVQSASAAPPLWVVSELYYPEETSTGFILTRIAEGLAASRDVRVICGQPSYSARGVRAPKTETRNNVAIRRVFGTTWNKDVLPLRVINLLTISFSIFWCLLRSLRKNDQVLVVTNPPLLPFVATLACKLKRARCHLLIHDVYPEVLVASGFITEESAVGSLINRVVARLYRAVHGIVVLGRDMETLIENKLDGVPQQIVIIPNWGDVDEIRPAPRQDNSVLRELGLENKFVVQYAGNMGRSHNIESILDCALKLRDDNSIHFLFFGSGAKKDWLQKGVQSHGLTNVTVLNHRPRSEQQQFLNACDVSLITFVPGMSGISVPSRMYNVMAAGKPIVAMVDEDSEVALAVREERMGWVVSPDDSKELAQTIRQACYDSKSREQMGMNARRAAEAKYTLRQVVRAYDRFLSPVSQVQGTQRRAA